MPVWRVVAP
uniref:Uncharacterized protein n=1 Tax=Anguilla anguilla TaxID=7936 RepID=A0A0E9U1E8_ANGAN